MRRIKSIGILLGLLLLLVAPIDPQVVSAHQSIQVGDYSVEYGWLNEPPVAGQPNAVVINISSRKSAATTPSAAAQSTAHPEVDVSGLKIQVVYGGQNKQLALQPLGEDTPGQFIAPLTPTRAGVYTVQLGGSLGGAPVNVSVQPEEVQTADTVQFPLQDGGSAQDNAASASGPFDWLGLAGVILGAIGTIFGLIALLRKPANP